MALSREDVKRLLISLLPTGSEQLYALENTDYIGGTFYGIAGPLKNYGTDRIVQLRKEGNPSTIEEDIPDWEEACGLTNTPIAKFGTLAQRRNAVLSVLREHGSFSLDDIRAAVQPYLLYADSSQIQILETDRAALRAAHTYSNATPITVMPTLRAGTPVTVLDDPRVSPAGAVVSIEITATLDEVSFQLAGPGGFVKSWPPGFLGTGAVVDSVYTLFAIEAAGRPILGTWTLFITAGAGDSATLTAWSLFTEGLGVNFDGSGNRIGQGLGAAIYEFAVIADPALLGTGYDIEGAYQAIQKVKPAHVLGDIVVKNSIAGLCAIPDEPTTLPERSIPCT